MANPKSENKASETEWVNEEVGFAPYWSPEPGKTFIARPVNLDATDPAFIRYTMLCEKEAVECARGPVDDAEPVTVHPGERFSISAYKQLADLFIFYMESGIFPLCRVTADKEVKTKTPGQTVWLFKVEVTAADKKRLEAARKEKLAGQLAERGERAAMQSASA